MRELAVRSMGDAHGDARLAGARRADEAQHAALDIGRELAHGQILCDPVLDLLKPEVLFVKHLARGAHIEPFLGARVPRQIETNIQIIADDGRLRRAERLLLEPVDLFEQALLGVLRQVQGKNFLAIGRALRVRIIGLAELRLDDLHLLAHKILLLRLIQVADFDVELAEQYEVQANPTLILFKDGQAKDRKTGALKQAELNSWIEGLL